MNTKTRIIPFALLFVLGSAGAATDSVVAYTIAEGEDIQTIAGTYDVSVEDILVTNGLETEEIAVGTVIYIPPKHATGYFDPETGVYTIAKGDDLLEISRRFGTTVEAIESTNGLENSRITAGATLVIP
ncbi:LysM peptidoglycan-binding domain-containing protein [Thiocapsa rosea]|uniref:LysM peptidoglycan-binding domain-containing protein n=1 Tax=Thiocapsa rosea TaxID=69360 RepID=UPI000EABAEE6|nr:LysM peptidoglycan-binding domain-containing protein [Thiocapsa rosea]